MTEYATLAEIRQKRPLVHCVSNIVSANDCANLALALGASPMMALAVEEMEEITSISDATVLNTGTPEQNRFEVCRICFREAEDMHQPVILDPVGVGASSWRLREVKKLLENYRPLILRVNLGEAQALCGKQGMEQGVDSVSSVSQNERSRLAEYLAREYGTVVLLTGKEDLIHDGTKTALVTGGSERIGRLTGTGDMLSVLCGAFSAVEKDPMQAAVRASSFWKICAEHAEKEAKGEGTLHFRAALMHAAETLTDRELRDESRVEYWRNTK